MEADGTTVGPSVLDLLAKITSLEKQAEEHPECISEEKLMNIVKSVSKDHIKRALAASNAR